MAVRYTKTNFQVSVLSFRLSGSKGVGCDFYQPGWSHPLWVEFICLLVQLSIINHQMLLLFRN